jgi:hypothetical protein
MLQNEFKTGVLDHKAPWNTGFGNDLEKYFTGSQLKHQSFEDALLPAKDFYIDFPDNVRKFLNEETVYGDVTTRSGFEVDVYAFLKNHNLPFDDKSIGVATIRRVITGF